MAAMMAQDDPSWSQVLPLILLGLRTINPEEFAASLAELVYEENLRLPIDPVHEVRSSLNSIGLLHLLRDAVSLIKPPPPTNHEKTDVSVPRDLESCTQVLVLARTDTFRRPLFSSASRAKGVTPRIFAETPWLQLGTECCGDRCNKNDCSVNLPGTTHTQSAGSNQENFRSVASPLDLATRLSSGCKLLEMYTCGEINASLWENYC